MAPPLSQITDALLSSLSELLTTCSREAAAGWVACDSALALQEEFCYPVECLALTVEEVMHIRQVLVKAELEKYQQYKDVYTALKKGKVGPSCGSGGEGSHSGDLRNTPCLPLEQKP